ncbi:hypothetical protein FAES_2602 [Fibrella aestuarina BUZ 2]|uniref:DUF1361 domain-containing protein n=1 Tax=Fibrella aestuarina BUZ 2 TaxID=1166018 RepID=I0K908_9BACT|nr:DUF1361 domain-containing protein [Fibrella aestuarina]CCH00611.1 hypothetical protein FAES_2602 [Fibrella aestuarina BUZ 2]
MASTLNLRPALTSARIVLLLTVGNVLILLLRNWILGGSNEFNFLFHNLFSGFEPLLIAYVLLIVNQRIGTVVFWIGTSLWVLFYPNSPYMISDLIHVTLRTNVPTDSSSIPDEIVDRVVFNVLIVFSFAMLSVFYGFVSLKIMYSLFRVRYSASVAKTLIGVAVALSCVGFYIGRTIKAEAISTKENLYSADFLFHPIEAIGSIWPKLFPSAEHEYPYYMMILFGIVQCSLLLMMRNVRNIESNELVASPRHGSGRILTN